MADFVYFVYDLFDIVRGKVACSERAFHETAFELRGACRYAMKCGIQCDVEFGRRGIDNGRPTGFHGQVIRTVRERCVVKERGNDCFVVGVKSLFDKVLTEFFKPVFKLFADKAQKYERQHHIALFKERTRITCLTQYVAALKQYRFQIYFFFRCLFSHYFLLFSTFSASVIAKD